MAKFDCWTVAVATVSANCGNTLLYGPPGTGKSRLAQAGAGDDVYNLTLTPETPSAELRDNQKDEDSLPAYPVRDDILECLVDREMRVSDIVARGHDVDVVKKIERLLYLAEYKRRQSAPGVKVTLKNFGRDRRYPIINRFRDPGLPVRTPDAALAPKKPLGTSERFEE